MVTEIETSDDISSYRRSLDTPRRASTYAASHRGSLVRSFYRLGLAHLAAVCRQLQRAEGCLLQDEGRRWLKLGSPSLAASFMGSQVGSLPAGMSPADRLSLSQSTPASPLVTNISSLPPVSLLSGPGS